MFGGGITASRSGAVLRVEDTTLQITTTDAGNGTANRTANRRERRQILEEVIL